MDAESLAIILDNTRKWYEDTYRTCVAALEEAEALPGMRHYPGEQEGYDLAAVLGRAVKDMIWRYARREHGLTDDERTLAGTVFSTALGHVSDADLGAHYYTTTRERWCGEHDIDPYPARNG
jgi:hypothetical protein